MLIMAHCANPICDEALWSLQIYWFSTEVNKSIHNLCCQIRDCYMQINCIISGSDKVEGVIHMYCLRTMKRIFGAGNDLSSSSGQQGSLRVVHSYTSA